MPLRLEHEFDAQSELPRRTVGEQGLGVVARGGEEEWEQLAVSLDEAVAIHVGERPVTRRLVGNRLGMGLVGVLGEGVVLLRT